MNNRQVASNTLLFLWIELFRVLDEFVSHNSFRISDLNANVIQARKLTFSALSATFIWCREHTFTKHDTRASKQSEVVRLSFPAHRVSTPVAQLKNTHSSTLVSPSFICSKKEKKTELHYNLFPLSFFLYFSSYYYPFILLYQADPVGYLLRCTLKSWRERQFKNNAVFWIAYFH